jgi:hypothetical protein
MATLGGFVERFAKVNGVRLHYLSYAETSHMWAGRVVEARSRHAKAYAQAKLVASDVRGQVIAGSGHWLMEEAPKSVIPALLDFLR